MLRWVVLWQAASAFFVGGTIDFRTFNQRFNYVTTTQVNCYEPPKFSTTSFPGPFNEGWLQKRAISNVIPSTTPTYAGGTLLNEFQQNEISPRIDRVLIAETDIVKEHAKLVQDINGLRQLVFVAPFFDDSKDYEDSIFHEIIETSSTTTTTPRPTSPNPPAKTTKSIPLVLLGGASQRQIVKSKPLIFPKPTISLVGTTVSSLVKSPYSYVLQTKTRKPIKFCMTSMPTMYKSTRRLSLLQRLLNAVMPNFNTLK